MESKWKMHKWCLFIIILLITVIVATSLTNFADRRKIALRTLDMISTQMILCEAYYIRNANNIVDYGEIRESLLTLNASIRHIQYFNSNLLRPNSAKAIDVLGTEFNKFTANYTITEDNAELFFGKVNELWKVIRHSLETTRLWDISQESFEAIVKILGEIHQILS